MQTVTVRFLPFTFLGFNAAIHMEGIHLMAFAPEGASPEMVISQNLAALWEPTNSQEREQGEFMAHRVLDLLGEETVNVLRNAWALPEWPDEPETTETLVRSVVHVRTA